MQSANTINHKVIGSNISTSNERTVDGWNPSYLSNESSNTTKLILFDEMNVTLTRPILQVTDYYPFGMAMAENGYENIIEQENKFKYNGKELQDDLDLNLYDYGARFYDPAIGRWYVVDPLADQMRRFSPYNYALSNIITHYNKGKNSKIYGGKIGVVSFTKYGKIKESYNTPFFSSFGNSGDSESYRKVNKVFGLSWGSQGIIFKVKGDKIHGSLNTASNIISTLDHENQHLSDLILGIPSTEQRAIDAQRSNKVVWDKTTDEYKRRIKIYENNSKH